MSAKVTLRRLALSVPVVLAVVAGGPGRAAASSDIEIPSSYTQSEFRELTRELGLAVTPYQVRPAAPLGFLRFDAGVEMTFLDYNEKRSYWQQAVDDPDDLPGFLPVPKLHGNVGLPVGIDLGLVFSKIPGSNIEFVGGDVKWSIFRGGMLWPALAVRGGYTQLRGVDQIDLETRTLDVSISKGIPLVSAYLGAGRVWIDAEAKGAAASLAGLGDASHTEDRVFGGVRLRLGFLSLVGEASIQHVNAYTLRANISF
jgi:hypothetical protein